MKPVAAVAALALVAAGCAGGEEASAEKEPRAAPPLAATPDAAAPAAGRVLLRFVRAARDGDGVAMWSLLSGATRGTYGRDRGAFVGAAARDLHTLLRGLRRERLVLARSVGRRWAVAAVAGVRTVDDEKDDFSYGVALAREGGGWRIELGGAVISGLEPEPAQDVDPRAEVAADVSVAEPLRAFRLWVDGAPLRPKLEDAGPFRASFVVRPPAPLAPGRHDAVAFAATDTTAVAVAWPFSVER